MPAHKTTAPAKRASKQQFRRSPSRRAVTEEADEVTPAQQLEAIAQLRKTDGRHKAVPCNRLVGRYPAETVKLCADALGSLPQPDGALGALIHMIADALGHAETVLHETGTRSDFERELQARTPRLAGNRTNEV